MDIDTPENLGGWSVQSILDRLKNCETELRRQREMINQTDKTLRGLNAAPVVQADQSDHDLWTAAVAAAASAFLIYPEAILGRSRRYCISTPRHTARYLLYHVAGWTSPRVAYVSRTDHGNVLHSVGVVQNLKLDARYKDRIAAAERIFRGGSNA